MKKEFKFGGWISAFIFAILLIIVYKTLDNLTDIASWFRGMLNLLMPFIMGIIIAYLLYIPASAIERAYRKIKLGPKRARTFSVLTTYVLAVLLIIIVINFVFPIISASFKDLFANIPNFYSKASEYMQDIPEGSIVDKLHIQEGVQNIASFDIAKVLSIESIGQYAKGILGVASGIFNIFVTMVVSVYLLLYRSSIVIFIKALCNAAFKPKVTERISYYFKKSNEVFFKFIGGQILDGFIVGILVSIAMSLLGVKYAILLGFVIGLFNIIPYFGAIVAILLATIITIFTGGIGQAISLVVIVTIIQQIDSNIINPKILGDVLEINPLLVIFSVTVGGAYFGILGMFLAVPIVTIIKILLLEYINKKNVS